MFNVKLESVSAVTNSVSIKLFGYYLRRLIPSRCEIDAGEQALVFVDRGCDTPRETRLADALAWCPLPGHALETFLDTLHSR